MTTRVNHLEVLALVLGAAVMLAASMLALVGTVKPAGAAFPGQNGRIVFEGRGTFGTDIFSITPGGTDKSQLTETENFNEFNPSYSADGTQVVFDTDRNGNQEIYKMTAGGSDETRLTTDSTIFFAFDGEPAFSPDGSEIVFARINQKGQNTTDRDIDIYTMSANGGAATRVVDLDGNDAEPSFSPDGSKIVFDHSQAGVGTSVYVVNRNGTDLRSLAEGRNPSWSPDGSLITFERNAQIFVMSADGSNQRQITPESSASDHLEPTFAPDCTRIAYVKDTFTQDPEGEGGTRTFEIYTTDLAGGDEQRVIGGSERVADPDWQPLSSTDAVTCPLPPPPPPTPQISIADTTVNEGNSGTSEATFDVTLSEASTNAVTVDYATDDDTATQPEDYQQTQDTLTFGANQTTATVTVLVSGDTADEPDETFFVNLSNPTNATISDAQATGTITNDDQDTKAPQTDIALDPPTPNGENDWYTNTVKATISASDDSGSGVAETRCVLDPASPPVSFDDLPSSPCAYLGSGASVSGDGQHTLYAASKDEAGNKETPQSASFKIDTSPPTISNLGTTTPPNANGWYKTDVTNSFKASDSGSGLSTACQTSFRLSAGENVQSKTTSGEGSALKVTSDSCTDMAGNTATGRDSATFKIDKTAPSVSPTIPQAGARNVSRTTVVKATFSEVVQAATLTSANVQLFSGNSTKPVKAALSWDPLTDPTSVTLTPSSKLDANKTYTAKIKGGATGVKDLADNPLSDFSWTFTTGAR
jgi:Tol biopolymer transport system component